MSLCRVGQGLFYCSNERAAAFSPKRCRWTMGGFAALRQRQRSAVVAFVFIIYLNSRPKIFVFYACLTKICKNVIRFKN